MSAGVGDTHITRLIAIRRTVPCLTGNQRGVDGWAPDCRCYSRRADSFDGMRLQRPAVDVPPDEPITISSQSCRFTLSNSTQVDRPLAVTTMSRRAVRAAPDSSHARRAR
jgi:hypothetical protein